MKKVSNRIYLIIIILFSLCVFTVILEKGFNNNIKNIFIGYDINPASPTIPLLMFKHTEISSIALFNTSKEIVPCDFDYTYDNIKITSNIMLNPNCNYILSLSLKTGSVYKFFFTTSGLPRISIGSSRQLIKIPAIPKKGFYWPYYLSIPSNKYSNINKPYKRYLLVESNNTGDTKKIEDMEFKIEKISTKMSRTVFHIGENLTIPVLIPAFPRPHFAYYPNDEKNYFNTHSLDRDTMLLELNLQDKKLKRLLKHKFKDRGLELETMKNIDLQLIAMINHATTYLNQNNFQLETNKFFLNGYSASGCFANRFSYLHPEMIKAVACGATLDDMMLPLSTYDDRNLIYPIGIYDYNNITHKDFNLKTFNSVARLIFMGENDFKNTLSYIDCFGAKERDIIIGLWGEKILPRAESLINLYGIAGGKGMLILDNDIKHSKSVDMINYLMDFFKSNRNSHRPFYPVPKNSDQLKYTLYN